MAFPKFNVSLPKFDTSKYDEFENPAPEAPPRRGGLSAADAVDPYAVLEKTAVASNAALWEAKKEALRNARTETPDKMERISQALLAFGAPTGGNNWAALSNAAKSLSMSGKLVSDAERERANQLAQIEAQRREAEAAIRERYGLESAKARHALTLKGMDTPKVGFDPVTGKMKFMEGVDVGKEVTPGGQPTTQAPSALPKVVKSGDYSFLQDTKGGFQVLPKPPKEPATPEQIAQAIEDRATAGIVGKEAGKAQVALPGAKTQVARSLNLVDSILSHKGLSAVVGAPNPFKGGFGFAQLPGSDAASFASQLKQLEGQAFLEAFNTLRGAGAISEKEGEAATQAYANLSKSQSEEQFKKNVAEIRNILTSGYANLEQIAKGSAGLRPSSAPAAPETKTINGVTYEKRGNDWYAK